VCRDSNVAPLDGFFGREVATLEEGGEAANVCGPTCGTMKEGTGSCGRCQLGQHTKDGRRCHGFVLLSYAMVDWPTNALTTMDCVLFPFADRGELTTRDR
jgi:hypothetical protein